MKMKKHWWVSRDWNGMFCNVWSAKPVQVYKGEWNRNSGYLFSVLPATFESQTGITLEHGECKRIVNPFWKGESQ